MMAEDGRHVASLAWRIMVKFEDRWPTEDLQALDKEDAALC